MNKALDAFREWCSLHVKEVIDINRPKDLYYVLQEYGKYIWSDFYREHRWWNDIFMVVQLDDLLFGFIGAETTGDMNAVECGFEFDPNTICFVEPYEIKITKYRKKEE